MSSISINSLTTSRQLLLLRMAAGISLRQVAARLGVSASTLRNWELSGGAISSEWAKPWRAALSACAQERRTEFDRYNFTVSDIERATAQLPALFAHGGHQRTPDDAA